jgi:hypothetical protein
VAERGTGFPRINLSNAVQVMDAASKFGKAWKRDTFATHGAKSNAGSSKSGAFKSRLAALKEYGLIKVEGDDVHITDLASQITKPVTKDERLSAIASAFMLVGTFSDLFSTLEGGVILPKSKVLEYAVHNLGISRESKDKFISCFIESGRYVGLVEYLKDQDAIILRKTQSAKVEPIQVDSDDEQASEKVGGLSGLADELTSNSSSVVKRDGIVDSTTSNEQGVNHAGDGWSLTVLVKSGHRLPAELRKNIRDLLEQADIVADQFYDIDSGEK